MQVKGIADLRIAQVGITGSARYQVIKTLEGLRFVINDLLAKPLYEAAGVSMPEPVKSMLESAREILPTLRPAGELAPYVGEALQQLRQGVDQFLNVAPEGCMVASMGEVLSPKLISAAGQKNARMENLFSSDGDVDEEPLAGNRLMPTNTVRAEPGFPGHRSGRSCIFFSNPLLMVQGQQWVHHSR